MNIIYDSGMVQFEDGYKQVVLVKTDQDLFNIEIYFDETDKSLSYALLAKWERGEYGNILNLHPVYHFGIENINPLQTQFQTIVDEFSIIINKI